MKTKTTKKALALLLALAMALTLFAGCSNTADNEQGEKNPTTSNSGQLPSTDRVEKTEGSGTVDSSKESVLRDEVNVALTVDLGTWNPFNVTSTNARQGVYQSLGYLIDGEYYPCLMKEYSFNEDMTVIYCELFDNIYDSNGVHMTAADIVWSYEMANKGTTAGLDSICEGCYQTGDYTFEFRLYDTMQVGRMDKILKWYAVCRESYENSPDEMASTPVGTGPYVVTNMVNGYCYTVERRDDYWQTDESMRSYLDQANAQVINYYIIPESAQRAIALENGTIDFVTDLSEEELATFENSEDFWVFKDPADKSMDFVPNCDPSSALNDINLRLACFYAINPDVVLTSVYGTDGGYVNHSIAPDWAVGYNEAWADVESYYNVYDPALAKDYLAKSSYSGQKLKLMSMSDAASTNAAQVVQSLLEEVGIYTEISSLERNVYKQYLKNVSEWDIAVTTFATNTYWIDGAYGQLSKDKTDWGSSQNFIYDDELQEMLDFTISMKNANDENYTKLNQYIIDNAYWYSLVNPITFTVCPSWCSSMVLNANGYLYPGGCTYTE